MEWPYSILIAIVALGVGVWIGRRLLMQVNKKDTDAARQQAAQILAQAETDGEALKEERIQQAKEKFSRLKSEFEKESNRKKNQLVANEQKLKQQEQQLQKQEQQLKQREQQLQKQADQLAQREGEVENIRQQVQARLAQLSTREEEVERFRQDQIEKLEKIAGLSADEARQRITEELRAEATSQAAALVRDIVDEARLTATKQAKKVVLDTLQRTATEHTIENCVSVFNIESDDIKGKVIGREGRNIRALEAATGVEIIVDDTPEAIIISGFDPVRREVARLALHRLVADGRIHPARIEEVVAKTQKNIEEEVSELGERACIDLGIHGLHPELIKMVGRLRFRSSYGQNLLQHSREVANLCATMAAELGLNAKLARRAGLLHDIGKVWPEEPELPHAILGMELAKKYKEHKDVINAIGAHHDEIEMTSLLSPIVQICDAISGARPGARREVVDAYIQRLKDLETLATSFPGVNQCYAIQAGRELRIMVDAEAVSDEQANLLSFQISQKIEKEMQYPGQIKVTVIREMRSVSYAK